MSAEITLLRRLIRHNSMSAVITSILANLCEEFNTQVHKPKRLKILYSTIKELGKILDNTTTLPDTTVVHMIKTLITLCINKQFIDDRQFIEYLKHREVASVVQLAAALSGGTDVILDGMFAAVETPNSGVGINFLQTFIGFIVNAWFTLPNGEVLDTKPGFILRLFIFLDLCGDRQQEVCGNRDYYIKKLDDDLLPVVKGALKRESPGSLLAVDVHGRTTLHRVLSIHRLPQVIQALLDCDKVDVNALTRGMTPLAWMLYASLQLKESHAKAASLILNHPLINIYAGDSIEDTPLVKAIEHFGKADAQYQVVVKIIKRIAERCETHRLGLKPLINSMLYLFNCTLNQRNIGPWNDVFIYLFEMTSDWGNDTTARATLIQQYSDKLLQTSLLMGEILFIETLMKFLQKYTFSSDTISKLISTMLPQHEVEESAQEARNSLLQKLLRNLVAEYESDADDISVVEQTLVSVIVTQRAHHLTKFLISILLQVRPSGPTTEARYLKIVTFIIRHESFTQEMGRTVMESCIRNLSNPSSRPNTLIRFTEEVLQRKMVPLMNIIDSTIKVECDPCHHQTASLIIDMILSNRFCEAEHSVDTINSMIDQCIALVDEKYPDKGAFLAMESLMKIIASSEIAKTSDNLHKCLAVFLNNYTYYTNPKDIYVSVQTILKSSQFTLKNQKSIAHMLMQADARKGVDDKVVTLVLESIANLESMTPEVGQTLYSDFVCSPSSKDMATSIKNFISVLFTREFLTLAKLKSFGGKSVLEFSIDLLHSKDKDINHDLLLHTIKMIFNLPSIPKNMVEKAVAKLIPIIVPSHFNDLHIDTAITGVYIIDSNKPIEGGMNAGQLAIVSHNVDLTTSILELNTFDVNSKDSYGCPIMFYICKYFARSDILMLLRREDFKWNFSARNMAKENILDYYEREKGPHTSPSVVDFLAAAEIEPKEVDLKRQSKPKPRDIQWDISPSSGSDLSDETDPKHVLMYGPNQVQVSTASRQTLHQKLSLYTEKEMYNTYEGKNKGKVCMISISKFDNHLIYPALLNYKNDIKQMTSLWNQVGLEVYTTSIENDRYEPDLTAEEIEIAVADFAQLLTEDDRMAVFCILSHGGDGYIVGRDGGRVPNQFFLEKFSNINCSQMAGRPKIIIFQTCQGDASDEGIMVRAGLAPDSSVTDELPEVLLPSMSDMIVCSPSMPGFASFVSRLPNEGSIYIKYLMDVFTKRAATEDLNTLLTLVNNKVSNEVFQAYKPGTRTVVANKQMPNFLSCLTKVLYLWPGIFEKGRTLTSTSTDC